MRKVDAIYAGGVQQFPYSDANAAREIKNLFWNPELKAWNNDRGWISYYATASQSTASVYSIYSWVPRGKNERLVYEFDEGSDRLTLAYASPYEASGYLPIQTGRHKPTFQEAGTTYAPYGEFLIIANGYDQPIKWFGYSPSVTSEFGFQVIPSPPQPIDVGPGGIYGSGSGGGTTTFSWDGSKGANDNFIAVNFDPSARFGLGEVTPESSNGYSYRVSFITDTQSESPLSAPSSIVAWVQPTTGSFTQTFLGEGQFPAKHGVQLTNIPVGPPGTIKRRLYRTKNLTDLTIIGDQATYYFLDDITNNYETSYGDLIPDSELGSEAPTGLDSAIIPANLKFVATLGNRVVLGGGNSYPTRVFFSKAYRPEQFGLADFIELGNRDGGEITGFVPYNNLLLIFRERGIDALVPTQDPDAPFYATPIYVGLGTFASKTAVVIGGLGVMFATAEGVYVFQGNFSGGSQVSLQKISDQIGEDYARVSPFALARASAVYDAQTQNYLLSIPTDGSSYNNLIFAYSTVANAWTIQESIPASCFATSREGFTLFGTNTKDDGEANPTSIGVLCNSTMFGFSGSYEAGPKPESSWTSAWLDFGDPDATKGVLSISISLYTTSNGAVRVDAGYDWDYDFVYSAYAPLFVSDGEQQTVYDIGVLGTDKWENRRITKSRVDVELPDVRYFRFRVSSTGPEGNTEPVKVIGFSIYYEQGGETYAWNFRQDQLGGNYSNQKVDPSKLPL